MSNVTFLTASARANGNSEQLARLAAESSLSDAPQTWLALREHPLEPFEDLRHNGGTYASPTGNALKLFEATVSCEHLVFATPLYWYSVPAPLKLYLDHWSAWMRVPELHFRERMVGKTAWAVTCSSGSSQEAQPMFDMLKLSARYMEMNWGGQLLGNGSAAGDVLKDEKAIQAAKELFKEIT